MLSTSWWKRKLPATRSGAFRSLFQNGKAFKLSPGPHNLIQKAVIEEFLPRFSPGCLVLYLGDTEKKILFIDEPALEKLGLSKPSREMLPDILAYDPKRKWLFVIEAVHSVHSSNPIGTLRHRKLQKLTKDCKAGRIYVSAFQNAKTGPLSGMSVGKPKFGSWTIPIMSFISMATASLGHTTPFQVPE